MRRKMAAILAIGLLVSALPAAAGDKAIDFSQAGRNEVYRDLPGVVTPEELEARREPVVCVRKHSERPLGGRWRAEDTTVYSCTYGNMTIETNQLPYSRERALRGIGW